MLASNAAQELQVFHSNVVDSLLIASHESFNNIYFMTIATPKISGYITQVGSEIQASLLAAELIK